MPSVIAALCNNQCEAFHNSIRKEGENEDKIINIQPY